MSLITHHIETDEGHHNHVKLFVRDDPEYDCLQKLKFHEEFFFENRHLGSPVRSWKRFHWFFPARLLHCGNVPAAIIKGKEKG